MNLCLLQSVTACVELFGGGKKRRETVVQTRGTSQIDPPELDLAGLERRKDVDLFPISQHKKYGVVVRRTAIITSRLSTLVLRVTENTMKYREIYNFQVSSCAIDFIDFSNCTYN